MKGCIFAAGAIFASVVAAATTPPMGDIRDSIRERLQEAERLKQTAQVQKACADAVVGLGPSKVDARPLNATVVTKNWSDTCVLEPYCIIQPTSAQDVAKALGVITKHKVKFAVRSGGHSPNPGWSSIAELGILIDMSGVNKVSLDAEGKVASVGPGAYWGDVSSALAPRGATVVGARAPYVGVGGLLLGGGYSYFASEFGLAVDNVKNYEIVLANGTITNANVSKNPDLFWALKGGGPNFGIVTKIDLYTVPIETLWYHGLVFLPTQAYEVLDALVEWQKNGASDPKTGMLFSAGLDSILVLLTYSEAVENPTAFSSLLALEPAQVAIPPTNSTLDGLFQLVSSAFPALPGRHDYRGVSSRIDAQLYKDMYDFWLEKAAAVHETTGANQTFVIQHVSKNVAAASSKNGGNPLNLPQEDHQWWTTLADWTAEADDAAVRSVSIDTTEKWKTLSRERGLGLDYLYMNDASRDQNPIASYGADNVAKLKATALKYDPGKVFQTLQGNGFLVSKA